MLGVGSGIKLPSPIYFSPIIANRAVDQQLPVVLLAHISRNRFVAYNGMGAGPTLLSTSTVARSISATEFAQSLLRIWRTDGSRHRPTTTIGIVFQRVSQAIGIG